MDNIATLEDLKPFLDFEPEYLPRLFGGDTSDLAKVQTTAAKILASGQSADLPVIVGNGWKIVLNVKPEAGGTSPEAHRDWHDVSLYLTGGNDITVGKGMKGAAEKEADSGEWRGGEIAEAQVINLRLGDLLLVPAGKPHENSLQPLTAFLVLKVKKGEEVTSPVNEIIKDWSKVRHWKQYNKRNSPTPPS